MREKDRKRNKTIFRRVLIVFVAIVLLQFSNYLFVLLKLLDINDRSAELNRANYLRTHAHQLAFGARETVIGDGELWAAEDAASILDEEVRHYENIRKGLANGNDELSLPGSVRQLPDLDTLMFGTYDTVAKQMKPGVVTMSATFTRQLAEITRKYGAGGTAPHLGPNQAALEGVWPLEQVLRANAGDYGHGLSEIAGMYEADAMSHTEDIVTVNMIINSTVVVLLIAQYVFGLRVMMQVLMGQARRTWWCHGLYAWLCDTLFSSWLGGECRDGGTADHLA